MKTHVMKFLFIGFFIINGVVSVLAEENSEKKNWHLFLGAEYYAVGNGNSGLRPIANAICNNPNTGSCTSTTNASGASGFRVAAFHEYAGMELGPSVGYLNGGPGAGDIILSAPNGGLLNYGASENTVRFLGETRKIWALRGNWNVRMGAGMGLATVNRSNSCYNAGTLNFGCTRSGVSSYSSMGWLTWEFSSAVVYKSISIGLRYVGFGREGQIPWNTPGAFFGVDF